MKQKSLLLASASSRRKELLQQIAVTFEVAPMDIDESVLADESPSDYVLRMAREKALAGLRAYPDYLVLGSDTTVVTDEHILGKPTDEQDAFEMLKHLSGSTHQVLSGIALAEKAGGDVRLSAEVVTTKVHFAELSDELIHAYIETGEPMDKAGAYGIQGKAALFVDRIEGSYTNVVGLPLAETGKLLTAFGIRIWGANCLESGL